MIAMQLLAPAPIESAPLRAAELPTPEPAAGELLVRVRACGVCHTDLHVAEGDVTPSKLPIVLGHQVVGVVEKLGAGLPALRVAGAAGFKAGDRVGIAWLRWACGACRFCTAGSENLCERAKFTGLDADGGYAQFACVPADFAYPIPEGYSDPEAAPLLCAGIVGYRALRRSGIRPGGPSAGAQGLRLGLYGFGASAHIVLQIARHWKCEVYVFTRAERHRKLALELGAAWVGRAEQEPPHKLDSAISFAPAGALVPEMLRALEKGGTAALAGIAMSATPPLDYRRDLYHEKTLTSVANATRQDGRELLALARQMRIETRTEQFPLSEANRALRMVKESRVEASAVLMI
ncbi:MAG: zinc-dependent alcohol dehydrogenase family protein [Candidatus Brocadiia bacterium]